MGYAFENGIIFEKNKEIFGRFKIVYFFILMSTLNWVYGEGFL
jgi:hypothetical protein